MEQRLLKFLLIQLKVTAAMLLVVLVSLLSLSFTAHKFADDLWAQLGISKAEATEYIGSGFLDGYLRHYGVKNAKNIVVGNRAKIVSDLGAYTRQYVNSDQFKAEYKAHRESLRPTPPEPAKTADELREEYKKTISASIKSMEEFAKGTNPDLKKVALENLPPLKQQLKELDNPEHELIKLMANGEKTNFEYKTKKYEDDLATWESKNPVDPKLLIKTRLKNFLELTTDIDFNAQLKERYGKMVFVNPDYERKPADWKTAFRAGKEAVTAARNIAQDWLKELN
jgi:hypothetical protein